jgi:anti-sigma regulatory factor (Ser/Thr protein kinase)
VTGRYGLVVPERTEPKEASLVSAEQISDTAERYRSQVFEDYPGDVLADIRLPFTPEAPGTARSIIRALATAWNAPEITEKAELCISEVVTNAWQHAACPGKTSLRLVVLRLNSRLRCEVHDTSSGMPHLQVADEFAESGRGMFLLDLTADDHGAYRTSTGKAVWFELLAWRALPELELP